ncbi:MAG: hypothetical protein A3J46_00600 [Candidatus Yanofskybacteria bacterium RIFCSPHIGHO2_02_FULL_41_11]|uniref:HD/PDEase domain-containing protein n=1 Tax=Candidatus Yanofskybacteria bacterium RIFCSPHIGHO2_02_FULL_41_11 TaxID=1802675 RepID=A0A1F8FAX8_9BACT|nr:MAG: hypothetical protein A3J46_00600 [Candidatus Yanofskybacteria bacterium RIFCSPHIGHO2_02_FULL_41_11]
MATQVANLTLDLEFQVEAVFEALRIKSEDRLALWAFLAPLKHKSPVTYIHYQHSLKVGLLARKIAALMHLDQKALLYAGLMHDLGKCMVCLDTLGKTEGWTENDTREIEGHVMDGYEMVRGRFNFTADIIVWHHKFQDHGYPRVIPQPLHEYSERTKVHIPEYGRLLALADVYDALHRVNDKFGEKRPLSDEEIYQKMIELNPDVKDLVLDLYNADIFIRHMEEEVPPILYGQAWVNTNTDLRTPEETARQVMIATALEPISDKAGCTTRARNVSRHLKLGYFITGGINLGLPFQQLAYRVLRQFGKDQWLIYDLALAAQMMSVKNRGGGRINQGIIEMLVPIVTAQCMYDVRQEEDILWVLKFAEMVMKNTSKGDVDYLIRMKRFAYQLSHYDRNVAEHPESENVFEYYKIENDISINPTSSAHNGEFVSGFPTVLLAYATMMGADVQGFENKVELAYQAILKMHDPEVGRGFLADCIAVAIYLVLSQNPRIKFIV